MLEVERLGKVYKSYTSEWQRAGEWFGLSFGSFEETRVLGDISFGVGHGEAIGIVGQNGAGKSTLLKLITGTLRPSEGSVRINGSVAGILELGLGFNPELTGRQNAWHAASILGHGADEIKAAMPEIERFSEIDQYFDEPVRVYSSGMQLRVAFSVVTAFRPELLIIDEALSVGDAYFQHKCFDRIKSYKKQGTSLLFVSHDAPAVLNLCDRAILLEDGKLIKDDHPATVLDFYNATLAEKEKSTIEIKNRQDGKVQTVSGSRLARVEDVQIMDRGGNSLETVNAGDAIRLQAKVVIEDSLPELVFGYKIKDRLGQVMYGTNTFHLDGVLNDLRKGERIVYSFDFPVNLGPGSYSISTALHSRDTHIADNYEWRELALVFHVINTSSAYSIGCNWMPPTWEVQRG